MSVITFCVSSPISFTIQYYLDVWFKGNTNKIVLNLKEKVSKFKQNLNNRDNIIYKLEVNVNILNIVMISTIIILIYNERNRSWF